MWRLASSQGRQSGSKRANRCSTASILRALAQAQRRRHGHTLPCDQDADGVRSLTEFFLDIGRPLREQDWKARTDQPGSSCRMPWLPSRTSPKASQSHAFARPVRRHASSQTGRRRGPVRGRRKTDGLDITRPSFSPFSAPKSLRVGAGSLSAQPIACDDGGPPRGDRELDNRERKRRRRTGSMTCATGSACPAVARRAPGGLPREAEPGTD
jgi:hypothetical protein